jgi:hypothetical protein
MRFIVRQDVSTSGMRAVSNRMKKAHLVQTKSRPMNLNTFISYGRLEESVAGPLNGKGKRWQSMAKLGTGILESFLRQDIFNAMLKAFTEKERNEVRRKTGSGKKGRWGNVLDYSDGVAIPYQVPLEKVMYQQNGRSNCFIASFFTVLHAAGYKKEAVDIFSIYEKDRERYEMKDDMKCQVLELVNRILNREGIMFGVVNTSGWHFLSGDDTFPLVVCIEEADGVVEHAVGIWKGKIYNPNQLYVLE